MFLHSQLKNRPRAAIGLRTPLLALGLCVAFGAQATAQLVLEGGVRNRISQRTPVSNPSGLPPVGANLPPSGPPTTTPQYANVVESSGGVSPGQAASDGSLRLARASLGTTFAVGVPRYNFGDEILPPNIIYDTFGEGKEIEDPANYWRAEPLRPGEDLLNPGGTEMSRDYGTGQTVAIPSLADGSYESFYYSEHAKKVFANTPGQVSVVWVSRVPDPDTNQYVLYTETFSVASGTSPGVEVRPMYWTEKSFEAPAVSVSAGRVETVNPVYSNIFPQEVESEYLPPGQTSSSSTQPELRTVWFEKLQGESLLRAYNVTGRLLVEYLGPEQDDGTHEFLGLDVVSVERTLGATTQTVYLGNEVRPVPENPEYLPSPVEDSSGTGSLDYYGSQSSSSGVLRYFAERENATPEQVRFFWLDPQPIGIGEEEGAGNGVVVSWPAVLNQYVFAWPSNILDYAAYTVGPEGSSLDNGTGLSFAGNSLPEIIYQDTGDDDALLDNATQRLLVDLQGDFDAANRSLLKFRGSNGGVWYVRLYTQAQDRAGYLEPDDQLRIAATAEVGRRIEPPAGLSAAGYIAAGTSYDPKAYRDPFTDGVAEAEDGAIIPVNALPGGRDQLTIRWFQKIPAPSAEFQDFYVSSKVGVYTLQYPSNPQQIVLAANAGSGPLGGGRQSGEVYHQPDPALPGYNPNEEHGLVFGGVAHALRDDLNVTNGTRYGDAAFTSQPFVLLRYISEDDGRPAMEVFRVLREDATHKFDYEVTAGTMLNSPLPLPYLPPVTDSTGKVMNDEVVVANNDPAPNTNAPSLYNSFTYQDRKGFTWVYRGPHAETSTNVSLGMQFHYAMRDDFYIPGRSPQPAAGTPLPYLRPLDENGVPTGDSVSGAPLTIIYRPVWPENPPELQLAETLALPKRGLPAVRGQSSAEVLYQQSKATTTNGTVSVVLHDPTRAKTILINDSKVGLTALPASLKTDVQNGKTFFQLAQPHLQQRFYYDPTLGNLGGLVLTGEFHDPTTGEDYLDLNTLSSDDREALKSLVADTDSDKDNWDDAVDNLATTLRTFTEDPAKPGTYIAVSKKDLSVGVSQLPEPGDSDTAVDSYALTATGKASGYVSLLVQDGEAFTEIGEPISIHIFKVDDELYQGDLKTIKASNPLDEQVTLRHSGDFAAEPGNFEFQWRYATAVNGMAPPTYSYEQKTVVGQSVTDWQLLTNPSALPSVNTTYSQDIKIGPDGFVLAINAKDYNPQSGLPGQLVKLATDLPAQTAAEGSAIFSANLRSDEGFVLYLDGTPQLAYNLPEGVAIPGNLTPSFARSGLDPEGCTYQFELDPALLQKGATRIEVALYSANAALPSPDSAVNFRLAVTTRVDMVSTGSAWTDLADGDVDFRNIVVLGGDASGQLSDPLLIFQDTYHTMRYRPKRGAGMIEKDWSDWTAPQLVESWVKRVLDGINPFDQRVADLYNNPVSTDVSLLTQAGKRWEGDVALNLDNINDFGLIEIYETVLNRVKKQSIDAGYSDSGVNQTLLLAAGYLNDLYMSLGNEAYDDAMNPTLQVESAAGIAEVSSSKFAFEGQVSNLLEETLALLRGRDDLLSPGTTVGPVYNRLYWNYTGGINTGEATYAMNYNIFEKSDDPAADGNLEEEDAARMFPQGHGDAYGHYLTALNGYYKLLSNKYFVWVPQSETISVGGQPVSVDYYDERKFAAAAAALARTGYEIIDFTSRLDRTAADPGWSSFSDLDSAGSPTRNSSTGIERHWAVDDWSSRVFQGIYFNWLSANAMLPALSQKEGVQRIDRTTVPEIDELVSIAENVSTLGIGLQDHLNSLGLPANAMAFDISPSEMDAGRTHFEQIYDRATSAALNARHSFTQASLMNHALRADTTELDEYVYSVNEQEEAYDYQLKDLLGTPYAGDIGPGQVYEQGYTGPDLYNWYFIDAPPQLVDLTTTYTVEVKTPLETGAFEEWTPEEAWLRLNPDSGEETAYKTRTYEVNPQTIYQFAASDRGSRSEPGQIQQALREVYAAEAALKQAVSTYDGTDERFERTYNLVLENVAQYEEAKGVSDSLQSDALRKIRAARDRTSAAAYTHNLAEFTWMVYEGAMNQIPVNFVNVLDSFKGGLLTHGAFYWFALSSSAAALESSASVLESEADLLSQTADDLFEGADTEAQLRRDMVEFEKIYYDLLKQAYDIEAAATRLQSALERVSVITAKADRIRNDRETFRRRAAAIIERYRTGDLLHRDLRHEFLEQYKSLFDLAQTYSFLAAQAYDYETGLLGTESGRAHFGDILGTYSLGEFSGTSPVRTGSGDSGLASALAMLRDDYSAAKGRLGLNNPDQNGTLFSLRHELFRIKTDAANTDDDTLWKQALQQHVVSDLRNDPDVLNHCANLVKNNNSAVRGIVIPFSTTIAAGYNFFGWPLAGGDHAFTQSAFATKISSAGVVFSGYVGMDPFRQGTPNAGNPASSQPNALSATPYVYLIPCGADVMRAPALGDSPVLRSWSVKDQALPLPLNIGGNPYGTLQVFTPQGTLAEEFGIPRKHQAFRAVDDAAYFYNYMPAEFTSRRLVGRSVWNTQWKLVIPAYSLLNDESAALDSFINSVSDIKLFLRTYSHSGN